MCKYIYCWICIKYLYTPHRRYCQCPQQCLCKVLSRFVHLSRRRKGTYKPTWSLAYGEHAKAFRYDFNVYNLCACELMCPLLKLNTLVIKMHMTVKAGMVLQVVATDHCCHLNWFFSSSDTAYQEDLQLTQDPLERFSLSAELETQVSATKRLEVVFCLFVF